MSQATEIQIADAVVAELNDAARTWTLHFTAARSWLPVYQPQVLKTLQVAVVALTIGEEKISREPTERMDYQIAIDFQQSISVAGGTGPADVLTRLVEEVHDFYRDGHVLATMGNVRIMKAVRDDVYDLDRLYHDHIWESYLALSARVFR